MTTVMIVEDEILVSMQIENYVKNLGYKVVGKVNNADDAIRMAKKFKPQIVLMDIHIKNDKDGISAIEEILKDLEPLIIYITAYCDEETIDRASKTNPIGYLLKPFNKNELMVTLRIAENKSKQIQENIVGNIILDNEFSFDSINQQLIYRNEYIHLTKKEKKLLELLINSRNNIVSIYNIENEIWPDKLANENTRRSLISRLRTKLNYKFIETVPSIGYRLK